MAPRSTVAEPRMGPPGWRGSRQVVFIVGLCLFVGLPTIRSDNYFLGDDFAMVQHLHDLPVQRLFSYFVSDWTEGAYGTLPDELRPFLAFSIWLDAHVFGATNAAGYHATNVVLHMLNALLVLAIARATAPGQTAFPLLAAALFAVAPSHAEPLAWISGRVDSLAALSYLGAFLCFVMFRRRQRVGWLVASLAIFVCGLFTKQTLITFPVLIVLYDLVGPAHAAATRGRAVSRIAAHVPFVVLLVLYLALRYQLFGTAVREEALSTSVVVEFVFLRQLFYAMQWLPSFSSVAMAVTIAALAVPILWMWKRRTHYRPAMRQVAFFGMCWYAVTMAPMIVTYPSARHLYLTSAGLAIAIAAVVFPTPLGSERERRAARLTIAVLLVVLGSTSLMMSNQRWIRSGIESGHAVASMPRLLEQVPPGSVVVVNLPARRGEIWFWAYALPFAVQPPFQADNLYDRFQFVEDPRVYCCRYGWWPVKERTFASIIDSPAPTRVTVIEPAIDYTSAPLLTTRVIAGLDLEHRLEASLGVPVERFATLTTAETLAIVPALMK